MDNILRISYENMAAILNEEILWARTDRPKDDAHIVTMNAWYIASPVKRAVAVCLSHDEALLINKKGGE